MYRVCFRLRVSDPYQYREFTEAKAARHFWNIKRASGYIGCLQYWSSQEQIWIG